MPEETNTDQAATEVVQDAPERIPDLGGLSVMPSDRPLMEALQALPPPPEPTTLEDALKAAKDVGTDVAGEGDDTDESAEPRGASVGESSDNETTQSDGADPAVARDLEKARTALKREGWDDATLKASSEEFILAQGKRSREAEAQREQQRQRIQELEASEEGGGSEGPGGQTTGPPQTQVATGVIDPVKLTQPLVDELGEDATAPIRVLAETVAQLQQTLVGQQDERAATSLEAARQQLGERFPELLDDAVYEERVKPEMEMLSATPRYRGKGAKVIADVMERAAVMAKLDIADPALADAESEARSQATRQKRAGTSAGPGHKGGSALSKASNAYLELEAFKALDSGDTGRYDDLVAEVNRRRNRDKSPI